MGTMGYSNVEPIKMRRRTSSSTSVHEEESLSTRRRRKKADGTLAVSSKNTKKTIRATATRKTNKSEGTRRKSGRSTSQQEGRGERKGEISPVQERRNGSFTAEVVTPISSTASTEQESSSGATVHAPISFGHQDSRTKLDEILLLAVRESRGNESMYYYRSSSPPAAPKGLLLLSRRRHSSNTSGPEDSSSGLKKKSSKPRKPRESSTSTIRTSRSHRDAHGSSMKPASNSSTRRRCSLASEGSKNSPLHHRRANNGDTRKSSLVTNKTPNKETQKSDEARQRDSQLSIHRPRSNLIGFESRSKSPLAAVFAGDPLVLKQQVTNDDHGETKQSEAGQIKTKRPRKEEDESDKGGNRGKKKDTLLSSKKKKRRSGPSKITVLVAAHERPSSDNMAPEPSKKKAKTSLLPSPQQAGRLVLANSCRDGMSPISKSQSPPSDNSTPTSSTVLIKRAEGGYEVDLNLRPTALPETSTDSCSGGEKDSSYSGAKPFKNKPQQQAKSRVVYSLASGEPCSSNSEEDSPPQSRPRYTSVDVQKEQQRFRSLSSFGGIHRFWRKGSSFCSRLGFDIVPHPGVLRPGVSSTRTPSLSLPSSEFLAISRSFEDDLAETPPVDSTKKNSNKSHTPCWFLVAKRPDDGEHRPYCVQHHPVDSTSVEYRNSMQMVFFDTFEQTTPREEGKQ